MEIEQSALDELVSHAARQTKAQESLQLMATIWTGVAVVALLTWIFISLAS